MFIAFIALSIFDIIASYFGITGGYVTEWNPFMNIIITHYNIFAAIGVAILITTLGLIAFYLLWHHRIIRFAFIGLIGLKSVIVLMHFIWISQVVF